MRIGMAVGYKNASSTANVALVGVLVKELAEELQLLDVDITVEGRSLKDLVETIASQINESLASRMP